MTSIRTAISALALAGLAACGDPAAGPGAPAVARQTQEAPPGAPPGTCWGKHVSPAVIETVTEHVVLKPAEVQPDGTVLRPATYKTETVQKIVQERKETWFETPCAQDLTPEFLSSLQRALAVRGHYKGQVTGEMDARTRAAVRRYQKPQGLDSGILSLAAARRLGLAVVDLKNG